MRVISLLPAASEIVAALGASEHLVGTTHECDFPPVLGSRARVTQSSLPHAAAPGAIDAAVRAQQDAGAPLFTLDAARITALHPDVILTQALCDVCAVSETDVRALTARLTPAPAIVTLHGATLDGIYADIRAVAHALDVDDEADELLAGVQERVRHVHETLKAAQAPRPRVAVIEWTDPLYIAGHWVPEQVKRAGGIDVLGTAGTHSSTVSMDALRDAQPEVLLFAPCGYTLDAAAEEARACLARPEWAWARTRSVYALDANGLTSRPGPRVVDGIEAIACVLNPACFPPLDGQHAIRIV